LSAVVAVVEHAMAVVAVVAVLFKLTHLQFHQRHPLVSQSVRVVEHLRVCPELLDRPLPLNLLQTD
jgi:hypothetical protein